ncbi:DUF3703 domain-containing protein [Portibacter marinus]|uniref:DUF3703 domain-containing protein n=1 Tax=Portibacter marinus TaxID=2898660 RepID=UPI001F191777|nr:DUF3703 domain-containing protein [Portibacter marinus]
MKLYIIMPEKLKPFYNTEMKKFSTEYRNGKIGNAWVHLERAHIIGQRYPFVHSYVHWKMMQFGFRIKNRREILGQIPRLIFGGIKSFVGTVPIGNPGGADVPALKPFKIPNDLQEIFKKAEVEVKQ